ncbi:MAG: hypothetical protein ACON4T_06790 [Synechococcus sp.]
MKLASRCLRFRCPPELSSRQLRPWLLEQVRREGEPLRWAITEVHRDASAGSRVLQVEAVLIQ